MWRTGTIAFLALHGLIHLIGFVVPWKIASPEGFPYRTTILAGRVDLGDAGIRSVGVLWLLAALAFVLAGAGLWAGQSWWWPLAIGVAIASLVLCVLGLPDAWAGILANLLVLGFALFVPDVRDLART